ncbi:type II secretion system F family protein [Segeticoccus rhizosphaerae]|jgi:tight adherence protein B|uniref:type II secretion system F family protein n=1 Tax=Segeticoccus rhizosphaerae TaxID=1104777 RepID=UPI0010C019E3|nr:type II secretion system F family protein [Ornithinicoccus soli]
MTGSALGLLLGVGLFCIWWSCWPRPATRPRRRPGRIVRIGDEIAQAGLVGLTPPQLLVGCVVCGGVVFVALAALLGVLPVAACFAAIAGYAPLGYLRMRARKRRAVLRELWPDVVDHVVSAVRAGMALPESLSQLAVRGPVELRPAFASFAEDYRASGRFQECLDRLKQRLGDPVADRIIEALRVARDVGGSDLGRLLRTLSTFLREDARVRAELEARQSWTVNAARLALAAPWIVLALLATRSESIEAYSRPAGVVILVVGAVLSVVAYQVMRRIGRLPQEARVLR